MDVALEARARTEDETAELPFMLNARRVRR